LSGIAGQSRLGHSFGQGMGKLLKFAFSGVVGGVGLVATLLFQPQVFCGITIPLAARAAGWKAKAEYASLSPLGKLEIKDLEAVDGRKSRLALDSLKLVVDPSSLFSGCPEILLLDLELGMIDLEMSKGTSSPGSGPISVPFTLREASLKVTEGRIRMDRGAWIFGGVEAQAKGWDGRTPKEIQAKLKKLDWNGPDKEEMSGSATLQISKNTDSSGDHWTGNLITDIATVVDLSPAELIVPCRFKLEGMATRKESGDWKIDKMQGSWEGIGGVKLSTYANGFWNHSGDWLADLRLDPVDLGVAGTLLQTKGLKSVGGTLGGVVHLEGGTKKSTSGKLSLDGNRVQLLPSSGPVWPVTPAGFSASMSAAWNSEENSMKIEDLQMMLGQKGQAQDLQVGLDRPTVFSFKKKGEIGSAEPAVLQWSLRGMELAAVVPLVVAPDKLKVKGGQLSANGRAKIQGTGVELTGRLESRSMNASGAWIRGDLRITSAAVDFRGSLLGTEKIRMEEGVVTAMWEGGEPTDLQIKLKADWDWAKNEGWLMSDGAVGLAGLGQAWSGAKLWPQSGQANLHVEFSGSLAEQGSGLISLRLQNMCWLGETGSPWKALASSELKNVSGKWSLPEISIEADRGEQVLLDGQGRFEWMPNPGEGKGRFELRRAESSLLVPILTILTPNWKWQEASASGWFEYERLARQDTVKAQLLGAITVETGLAGQPRPVDFSTVEGSIQASWPSMGSGKVSVDQFALKAKHRDGTDAIQATLDKPLRLEKVGLEEWKPSGQEVASGVMQYSGWPIGLFGPLIFPEAKETSILGTMSGFLKVRSDPKKGILEGEVDLRIPDLTVDLPNVHLTDQQATLQARISLDENRELNIQKVQLAACQGGQNWIDLVARKDEHEALAVTGKINLVTAAQSLSGLSDWVSGGNLLLRAEVADPKDGVRKIGYSTEINQLTGSLGLKKEVSQVEVKSQGILEWKNGFQSLSEVQLTARGGMGNITLNNLSWKKQGALAWEKGRISSGWIAYGVDPWLVPSRWVDGDLVLGAGFWQPEEYGGSGEFDATLLEARLQKNPKLTPVSVRLGGDFEYDKRTKNFTLKDGRMLFSEYRDDPVELPLLSWRPGSISAQLKGGVLDLRGLLSQTEELWNAKPDPKNPPGKSQPTRVDLSVDLEQIVVDEATVGPVKVPRFRFGPDGILLEPSIVQVKDGSISASVLQSGHGEPVRAQVVMNRFPLGAILGSMIQDAKGPIGGWINLELTAQAANPTVDELRRSLSGQGSFRLYQAHLERLPSLAKALQGAGALLGSSFIAGSEINDLGSNFSLQGERVNVPNLQISGTALSANLSGWLNWFSQTLDFQLRFALTKEALQSSGQLQGAMTQLVGNSNDYYTKIPGDARITGTLNDPKVQMDIGKMLAEGGINLLLNAPTNILQGTGNAAGGATGAATQPASAILQGVGGLFKW